MLARIIFLLLPLLVACSPQDDPVERWEHAAAGTLSADISRDGTLAMVSSSFHDIKIWDLKQNQQRFSGRQQSDNNLVLFTQISDNNKYGVSADKDSFMVWDLTNQQVLTHTKVRESTIRDIAIANNGQLLIGKVNGVVVHVDIFSGHRLEFLGHSEKINSVALSPNGRYALTGSNDYTALLWETRGALRGQVIHRFTHPSRVTKVSLDPQGRYAFSAGSRRQSSIWSLQTGEEISRLQYSSRSKIFSAVRFSNDGKELYTGSPNRRLNRWDLQSGRLLQTWMVTPRKDSHPVSSVIHAIAETEDGKLVTESSSGYAEFWAKDTDKS